MSTEPELGRLYDAFRKRDAAAMAVARWMVACGESSGSPSLAVPQESQPSILQRHRTDELQSSASFRSTRPVARRLRGEPLSSASSM